MPTSRNRRPRRTATSRHPGRPAFPSDLLPFLEVAMRADAAEARGDAAAALRELETMSLGPDGGPPWRPWRVRRLAQLVEHEGVLPRWATSRWVLDQAAQALGHDSRGRTSRALLVAKSAGAAELLPAALDPVERDCRIVDRDWVFRQVFLYELGGLAAFVRTTAAPDLLAAADDLRAWGRAEVDAYRFAGSTSREITWEHLGTGRLIRTSNLGAAVLLLPDEFMLGRLVPIEAGEMFESAPLHVTEAVARRVAESPASWIEVLRDAADRETAEPIRTAGFDFGLLHDVPPPIWNMVLGEIGGLGTGIEMRFDDVALATVALALARASCGSVVPPCLRPDRGTEEIDGWPCLVAALLEPAVLQELRVRLEPGDVEMFAALAQTLPEPAAAVCRSLTFSRRSVA